MKGMNGMISGTLLQFMFKNYKSFSGEATLDMTATNIKENKDNLIQKNQISILPVAAVFGANASGKSNLFSAFRAMCRKVYESNADNPNSPRLNNYIVPFLFSKTNVNEPTEFEVCINIENKEYRYGFACTKTSISSEWLYEKPFKKSTKSKEKTIFERTGKSIEFGAVLSSQLNELNYCKSVVLDNQLLLNVIGLRNKLCYSKIYNWFYACVFINCSNDDVEKSELEFTAKFLFENKEFMGPISEEIKEIDPAINNIEVRMKKDEDLNEYYKFYSCHYKDDEEVKIPFNIESSGTKKMLALYLNIVMTLQIGLPLFIDELDAKLHPLLLRRIIQQYTDKSQNLGGGQLIFSSHNLVCLDSSDLRRDEIWFVEKVEQKSTLFSLYDFKDYNENTIRADLSFGKHYLAGRFGAIPFQREV